MSWKSYESDCPGCRPCVIDLKTGKPFPEDSEVMRAVNAIWETTTLQEKEAFHNVCCNNSRDPMELALVQGINQKIQESLQSN